MSSAQVWNFPVIAALASEVHGYAGVVNGLLDEGNAGLGRLVAAWQGEGASAYSHLQTKWNTASTELNAALANLAQTIENAGTEMGGLDQTVAGTFSG
jgi:early secretory antigenic target protein ESAT-6